MTLQKFQAVESSCDSVQKLSWSPAASFKRLDIIGSLLQSLPFSFLDRISRKWRGCCRLLPRGHDAPVFRLQSQLWSQDWREEC